MASKADYDRLGDWAVLKQPDANINRRKCTRQVPMKVLCLGAPRTGTLSMQEAMRILGYPSYHFHSVLVNVQDADMWNQAIRWKFDGIGSFGKTEFDQLLGHVSAITDTPAVWFWKELAEFYPEAKIVLVERDIEKWYKSIELIIDGTLDPLGVWVLQYTDPFWLGRIIGCGVNWVNAFFGSKKIAQAKKNARAAYRKHYADIRRTIPPERILEFDLSSGWQPLCAYLDKPVPDVPFPHRNEAASLKSAFVDMFARAVKNSIFNVSVVVGTAAVVVGAAWRILS